MGRISELIEEKRISTKFQEGDSLIFEIKNTFSGKAMVLFSAVRGTEEIKFDNDDKMFLGVFSDELSARKMIHQLFYFLQKVLERKVKKKIFLKEKRKIIFLF